MQHRLFVGGKVLGARGFEDHRAVLVRGGEIVAVVGKADAAALTNRSDIEKVDLRGRYLMPGFVDGHFHLVALALRGVRCPLDEAASAREAAGAMAQWAELHPDAPAVVGIEWDESRWETPAFPTRQELDAAVGDRPALARRICCHVAVANTAMLRLLPSGHRFVDTETGIITEDAVALATRATYPPREAVVDGMGTAISFLHGKGVTGIHDIIEESNFAAYVEGVRRARVPLRIRGYFHVAPDAFAEVSAAAGDLDREYFRAAGIKIYSDGSLGARTAALHEPYADGAGCGEVLVTPESLEKDLRRCRELGIGCAVHAIGDRAIDNACAAMRAVSNGEECGFRIEHAEIVGPVQLEAIVASGARVAMQPNFVRNWAGEGGLYERRLGTARWRSNNPFRAMTQAGVPFFFSSDGMPPGPLFGLRGATHHPVEAQRLAPLEALARYTGGRIEPGAAADLVVLSGNPALADADSIRVEAVWIGGETAIRPLDSGGRIG